MGSSTFMYSSSSTITLRESYHQNLQQLCEDYCIPGQNKIGDPSIANISFTKTLVHISPLYLHVIVYHLYNHALYRNYRSLLIYQPKLRTDTPWPELWSSDPRDFPEPCPNSTNVKSLNNPLCFTRVCHFVTYWFLLIRVWIPIKILHWSRRLLEFYNVSIFGDNKIHPYRSRYSNYQISQINMDIKISTDKKGSLY